MENKKKALGKGLEQLFATNEPIDFDAFENNIIENAGNNEEIALVPLKELRSNPYQPRHHFDQEALQELADSLKEHGVIQPIIVKKSIKGYEIVAGERRVKAAQLAGITEIPAIVRAFTDEQMMEIALLENLQRENLNPIEEALAYQNLINTLHLTQEQLSKRVGKSRSHVTNMLGLLTLPNNVKEHVVNGEISFGHAKVLSKLEDSSQIEALANKIIKEGLSVRSLERIANNQNRL